MKFASLKTLSADLAFDVTSRSETTRFTEGSTDDDIKKRNSAADNSIMLVRKLCDSWC